MTSYKLLYWKPTTIKHFKVFGNKLYVKNNDDNLDKFNARDDKGIFLGYLTKRKGYRCYNKTLWKIVDDIDLKVDEELPIKSR